MSIPFEVGDIVVPRFIVEWCNRLGRDGLGMWISTVGKVEGDEVISISGERHKASDLVHVIGSEAKHGDNGLLITYRVTEDAGEIARDQADRKERLRAKADERWKRLNDAMNAAFYQ